MLSNVSPGTPRRQPVILSFSDFLDSKKRFVACMISNGFRRQIIINVEDSSWRLVSHYSDTGLQVYKTPIKGYLFVYESEITQVAGIFWANQINEPCQYPEHQEMILRYSSDLNFVQSNKVVGQIDDGRTRAFLEHGPNTYLETYRLSQELLDPNNTDPS